MRLSHLTLSLSIALMFGCKSDKGEAGPAGEDGAPGETGPAGEDGADGEAGEDGAPGEGGETGPAGTDGANGEDGAPGADGEDGDPGADGEDGEDGAPGADGEDGEDGAPGADGEDGLDCWDLDGDGVADDEEDTNEDGVVDVEDCRADDESGTTETGIIFLGDLTLYSEREAEYFCDNYDTVFGNLTVHVEDLSALSCLVEVTGDLSLTDCSYCSLPVLQAALREFEIQSGRIEEAEYPSLESVGVLRLTSWNSVSDTTVISAFPSLTTVSQIHVTDMNVSLLYGTIPFTSLTDIGFLHIFSGEAGFTNLSGFSNLEYASNLWAINNSVLTDISGISGVIEVEYDLYIYGNHVLPTSHIYTAIAGIAVGGSVNIYDNGPD